MQSQSSQQMRSTGFRNARSRRLIRSALAASLCLLIVGSLAACSPEPDERIAEALELQSKGQVQKAVALIRSVLEDDPNDPEANFVLGRILIQNDQPGPALAPLMKAAASEDFANRAGLLLASTQLRARAYQGAIETTTRLLEADPTNRIALLIRGKSHLAAGEPEAALGDAQRILAADPDDYNAIGLKGGALVDLDRWSDAERVWIDLKTRLAQTGDEIQAARGCAQLSLFYRTQKKDERVEETLDDCLADHADDAFLLEVASDFYLSRGQADRVLALHEKAVTADPENLALWTRLANVHRTAGRIPEARAALERGLARVSDPKESFRYALAELLLEEGKIEQALEIRSGFVSTPYQNLFDGALALREGDSVRALELLEAGLARAPNHPSAQFAAGEAALANGNFRRASEAFREAIRLGDFSTPAALRLAQIEFASGNFAGARQLATHHLERRAFEGPTAHQIAIETAIRQGDFAAAKGFMEALKGLAPNELDWRIAAAAIARREEGPAAAAALMEAQSIDLTDPPNEPALHVLVVDLNASRRGEKSLALLTKAIARAPQNPALHALKARTLLVLDKPKAAREAVTRALSLAPKHPPSLEAQALVSLRMGQNERALESFVAAAEAAPRNPDYAYAAASLSRQQGDDAAAMAYLEEALRRRPGYPQAANDLAWLLANRGEDLDRALNLARVAIRQDQSVNNLDTLGWVRHQRGEFEQAVSVYEAALQDDGAKPSIRYRLGLALSQLGRTDEAREQLSKVVAGPTFPEVENARAALESLKGS